MMQAPARVHWRLFVAAAFLLPATAVHAQFTSVPAPAVYAIRNATVVQPDGSRTTGVNVIVRGSYIEAMGRTAAIPAGAHILAGDSMYIYPGIIDAAGAVKYVFPRDSIDRTKVRSWDPPRSLQGFMPARRVSQFLEPTDKEIADLRKQGVVAVAVHPTDMIMPGQGTLLMLRTANGEPQRMVLTPSLGAVMTLRPARGAYPGTGMGLMAFYRQTFIDARRMAQISQSATSDPRVIAPAFDPDYTVVQQALAGTIPTYFVANTADEIRTVFRLADEFRLKPTIIGGSEAWKVAAELKARGIPVLVSLDFPKPRQWKPEGEKKDSAATPATPATPVTPVTPVTPATPAQEPLPAALREKKSIEDMYANPARLAAAGVRFALTSGGEADIRAAMQKPIEFGLSEADALRAISASPAQILGLPSLGRVEVGLPATFIVTKKPLFEKDTKIAYTFVEGALETGGDTASSAGSGRRGGAAAPGAPGTPAADGPAGDLPASAAAPRAAGSWSIRSEDAGFSGTMALTQNGDAITGTLSSADVGNGTITGKLTGNAITMTLTLPVEGQTMTVALKGTIDGDTMKGTAESPMGNHEWTAARIPQGGAQ